MPISRDLLELSIDLIASNPSLEMDPESLASDVVLLACIWPDADEFRAAITSVCKAIEQLFVGNVTGTTLQYKHESWMSYHFQQRRSQGARAELRIVYQISSDKIRVRGFGHRHIPTSIYHRLHKERP